MLNIPKKEYSLLGSPERIINERSRCKVMLSHDTYVKCEENGGEREAGTRKVVSEEVVLDEKLYSKQGEKLCEEIEITLNSTIR